MSSPEESRLNDLEKRIRTPNTLIGYSLSMCVLDILLGRIDEAEIARIITDCQWNAEEDFIKNILPAYQERTWYEHGEKGPAIALRLLKAGKIHQPRNKNEPRHGVAFSGW